MFPGRVPRIEGDAANCEDRVLDKGSLVLCVPCWAPRPSETTPTPDRVPNRHLRALRIDPMIFTRLRFQLKQHRKYILSVVSQVTAIGRFENARQTI